MTLLAWEMSAIVWWLAQSLVLPFLGIGTRSDLFQFCGNYWIFLICWHIECNTLMALSFRVLNSSIGIPFNPLALLTAVLPETNLTSHPRMSGSGWLHHCSNTVHWDPFCTVLCIPSISSWSLQCLLGPTISVLYCSHPWAKCSLDISNFPEKIFSLSPSVVFF